MNFWRVFGGTFVGAGVSTASFAVLSVVTPILGFATSGLVGNVLPTWVFLLPLSLYAVGGGLVGGVIQTDGRWWSVGVGGLGAALGSAVIGLTMGLVVTVIAGGMAPGHAGTVDFGNLALQLGVWGALLTAVGGGLLGALGGFLGWKLPNQ